MVRAADDSFYIYVSVGSEVWVGASHHPLGPWSNAKADSTPLIPGDLLPGYHMIDAECFIDTDGQAYLYWGSGWNWVNGRCFAVRLHDDMVTFAGEIRDVTPPKYFEAPFMIERDNIYYLMYSDGKVLDDSYKIRYATGKTPYGPWKEGTNSPILSTKPDSSTYAPGHHAVFRVGSQDYILYHRRSVEELKKSDVLMRQLCIDSLNFDARGAIQKVRTSGVANFVNR